jgi:hypothetical protein
MTTARSTSSHEIQPYRTATGIAATIARNGTAMKIPRITRSVRLWRRSDSVPVSASGWFHGARVEPASKCTGGASASGTAVETVMQILSG